MKKIYLCSFFAILFLMSFAVVQGAQEKVEVKTGNYVGAGGEQIQIQERVNNQVQLRVGGVSANCSCNLTQEQVQNRTRLYAEMSNGEHSEIKVMPDRASETALERLRLKNCGENCTIELKEVGLGDEAKMAYELKTQRSARILGLFRTRMEVRAQVDADTGEIVRVRKPWWAFLASQPEE